MEWREEFAAALEAKIYPKLMSYFKFERLGASD